MNRNSPITDVCILVIYVVCSIYTDSGNLDTGKLILIAAQVNMVRGNIESVLTIFTSCFYRREDKLAVVTIQPFSGNGISNDR